MNIEIIKDKLEKALELDECIVRGENGTFEVIAVGAVFSDLSRIKKQQLIYGPLTSDISSNAIHALTIKAYSPEDWQKQKHFI
ncbi:BolA family protein [Psychromonas sp. PT13]|uniref:BolA family protein n=1 Tax=Psychromonas sp. PT13 TaxID=3439547 RepID=UPI003EBFC8D0